MARYYTRAVKAFWVEDDFYEVSDSPSLTVDDHEPVDTGLLDADGNTIWRAPNPIGFGKDEEW